MKSKILLRNLIPVALSLFLVFDTLKTNGFATGAAIGAGVLDSVVGIDQGFDT